MYVIYGPVLVVLIYGVWRVLSLEKQLRIFDGPTTQEKKNVEKNKRASLMDLWKNV